MNAFYFSEALTQASGSRLSFSNGQEMVVKAENPTLYSFQQSLSLDAYQLKLSRFQP